MLILEEINEHYMKQFFTIVLLSFLGSFTWAQDLYLIHLAPKQNTSTYLANPLQMLSQRALTRRANKSVALDDKDVPINSSHIQAIKNLNLNYVGASKWLNTLMVEIEDQNVITQLNNLSFVSSIENLAHNNDPRNAARTQKNQINTIDYGQSFEFINQIGLQHIHQAGFKGQNILIGVIDSGFPGVNTMQAFQRIRNENRIVDTHNFVNNNSIYEMHSHGTYVLSTMAADVPSIYGGTAPEAAYALYVSEDAWQESPKELMYWVQAAERADSTGVDVINTSLGYTTFDDPRYDFTYEEMDGNTAIISKGAKIAASRGIFLVNANGNDGSSDWHYLGAPADVPEVFSIGATFLDGSPAPFTSFGPNATGNIKPDVSALGVYVRAFNPEGELIYSNGTSLASPIMSGAVATLMSAAPNTSIEELKVLIKESAHLYPSYNDQVGYGIPNFATILARLKTNELTKQKISIHPNPATAYFKVTGVDPVKKLEIVDLNGRILKVINNKNEMNIEQLTKGIYVVRISTEKEISYQKLMIQ